MTAVHALTEVALAGAALGFVVFVALYQGMTRGRWRRTRYGQNVMALMAVGALLLSVAVAREFLDFLDPYLEWVRLTSFTMVAAVAWWRVALLVRAQSETDHDEQRQETDRHADRR